MHTNAYTTHFTQPHTPRTHAHSLEMLDKMDIPVIADGYPLVVAMNALLDAIKSISRVVNGESAAAPTSSEGMPTPGTLVYDGYRNATASLCFSQF